jgi:hypothetical protein
MEFNQKNVDLLISRIKKISEKERIIECDAIRDDISKWLLKNFDFDKAYKERLRTWPISHRNETAFGIATALQNPAWSLTIKIPNNTPTEKKRCHHEQTVSGDMNQNGEYTVTKSHTWSW